MANQDFDERLIVLGVSNHDFINLTRYGRFVCHGCVFVRDSRRLTGERVIVRIRRCLFVDVHVSRVHTLADAGETVGLDDVVLLLDLAVLVHGCVRETVVSV